MDERVKTGLRTGSLIVLLVLVLILCGVIYRKHDAFQTKWEENQAKIEQLQTTEVTDDSEQNAMTEEESKTVLNSAKQAGDKIADLQNQYIAESQKENTTVESDEKHRATLKKVASGLDEYFGEGSDFRTPWFSISNQTDFSGSWQFMTTYNFVEDAVSVIWECTTSDDEDNNLVSYVTGVYHSDTGLFDNLVKHVTTYGASLVPGTGGEVEDPLEDFDGEAYANNIMKMIEDSNIHVTPAPTRTPEEEEEWREHQTSLAEARAALKAQNE